MTEQTPRVATGPALMQKLLELEQKFDDLATEARAHWSKEEQRMRLVDQYINHNQPYDILGVNIFDTLKRNADAMHALEREMRRLVGAVEVALGDPGAAREVNGKHHRTG